MPSVRALLRRFWSWYQHHYLAVLVLTTAVFLIQLFHLYWLFTDVVLQRIFGHSFYPQGPIAHTLAFVSLAADYLEVPTLVSASLLYVNELRRGFSWRALAYLFMLNTQWIHIYWITDEVVVQSFAGPVAPQWNAVLAWIAILIDFMEIPVIIDTLRRVWRERGRITRRVRSRLNAPGAQPVACSIQDERLAPAGR